MIDNYLSSCGKSHRGELDIVIDSIELGGNGIDECTLVSKFRIIDRATLINNKVDIVQITRDG